jgi:hypothetical protein
MSPTVTEPEKITDAPGASIDLNACRFAGAAAAGSIELAILLGEATGRVESTGIGYTTSEVAKEAWKRPADLPAAQLQAILQRVEMAQGRHAVRFVLDAPSDLPIHARLDLHYHRAQRRKEREG